MSTPPSLLSRGLARAIDAAVVALVDVVLGRVMGFGFDWLAVGTVIVWVYFVVLDAGLGATLGKLALGLRVLGAEGGRPTAGEALRREAFTVLGAIPFVGPLLALGMWIWIALAVRSDPNGQGPHDRFAGGTRVVRA
jgi:uncharacterized RDD family membrane protein YckC